MKKLLFAFPVIALLAAGCNSSQQGTNQPTVQTPITKNSIHAPMSNSTPPQESTSGIDGWKTYNSSEFGFSFEYPRQDIIRGSASDFQVTTSLNNQNSIADFHAEQTNKNLKQLIQDQISSHSFSEPQSITLNGNQGYEGVGAGMISYYSIFIKNNSDLVQVAFVTGKDGLQNNKLALTYIQRQILKSLTFTK